MAPGRTTSTPRVACGYTLNHQQNLLPKRSPAFLMWTACRATSWGDMNPGYLVRYFDLRLARGYLRRHYHPAFLRAFDCLEAFASKSDLFRMTLLYREGGWHSDWKQTCLQRHLLRNLTSSTDNDVYDDNDDGTTTDFFAARDHDNFSNDTGVDHSCVVNASIGSRPGHPVVDAFLERLLINVRTSRYGGDAGPACAVRSMPPVLAASSVWPFTMRMRRRGMTTERGSRISPGGTRRGHPGSATSGGRERTPCNTNAPIAGGIRIGATMATLQ